jgi:xyloglucan-specific exo-beta-1,4-glucanase
MKITKFQTFKSQTPVLIGLGFVAGLAGVFIPRSFDSHEEVNFKSVKALRAQASLEKAKKLRGEPSRADYYDALAERIALRAYPYDQVDDEVRQKAAYQASIMPVSDFNQVRKLRAAIEGRKTERDAKEALPKYWENVGPNRLGIPYTTYYGPNGSSLGGRIGGLAFDPKNSNIMYLGAPAGGVWKTIDGGVNWKSLGDSFPTPYAGPIAVHPTKSNIVILGLGDRDGNTGSGNGIMRSEDAGATWTNIAVNGGSTAKTVTFDPDNPKNVLVGFYGSGGLFRSTDTGYTFTNIPLAGNTFATINDVTVGIRDSAGSRLWTAHVRNSGTFVSSNSGVTWTKVNDPATASTRCQIAASKTIPGRIYHVNSSVQKIFQGDWDGAAFVYTDITAGLPVASSFSSTYNWSQSGYDNHIGVARHLRNGVPQDFVYVGLITVAAWDGTTWTDIGQTYSSGAKTHNDQHCMAIFPGDETKMVFGNDGGVWPTTYNPVATGTGTWNISISASATVGLTMFYQGQWHPTNPTRMMGGTQDNASPVSLGNLAQWVNRTGGDGCGCAINPVNPLIQYGSAQSNGLYRTTNGWTGQSGLGPSTWGTDTLPFVTRMSVDPTAPNPLYVATNYLWRYNEGLNTWDARLGATNLCPNGGTVLSISVAPSNPQIIYVGTSQGEFWRTSDQGATWRRLDNVTAPVLASGAISGISVNPTNPNSVLLTVSGGSSKVLQIADTTLTNPALVSRSGSGTGAIPNIYATSITRDDVAPNLIWYISNDLGVFMTVDGGTTWTNATSALGLPICEVSNVVWTPGTGYLNAATYGRGMWRIGITEDRTTDNTSLKFIASGVREESRYLVKYKVVNEGSVQANNVQITSAQLKLRTGPTNLSTLLPLRLGTIVPGDGSRAVVAFSGPKVFDSSGTMTINGTYQVGTTVKTFKSVTQVAFQ